jgi:hypothetical protein
LLYRNQDAHFAQEPAYLRKSVEAPKIGRSKDNYWLFDGKLITADYDADADLDVFSSSKRGNILLKNQGGRFEFVDPASAGLPAKSTTANWVDYDNDGLTDLHLVPQGLYRQRQDHSFEKTRLLAFHPEQYQAAIVNWFDLDNDGRMDALLALNPKPSFKRWWEFTKDPTHPQTWEVRAYRNNLSSANHWLQLRLVGATGNRQALGAKVTVTTPARRQTQEVGSNEGAFFSQGHYRLYFGLGPHDRVDSIRIRWSDGAMQELRNVSGDRLLTIERNDRVALDNRDRYASSPN